MTWAGTGVNQPPTQSVRDRKRSVEMQEKPKQQTESEKLSEIYLEAYKQRAAKHAAEEARQIAAGCIRFL
jgi:hypothetical protein